ncbi:MAG TPA: glucose-6-phosphate isomerase [Planctomycetota bacterium]|nr:glucose-6-phosphate isomerase [Planctomycetota bacterium]
MDRIRFDYTHLTADVVGPEHGLSRAELEAMVGPSLAALEAVQSRRAHDLRWLDLPHDGVLAEEVLGYAEAHAGRFQNVVVLGIGGSALGTTALHAALNSPYHNLGAHGPSPRLFVLDNVDPDLVVEWLDQFDLSETLVNVISKSGGTAETMAQFLIFRQQLIDQVGEDAHREHVVVTTDAEQGVLREIVRREGYSSFEVPDGVGGRFSVLSAVGLLPLAMAGIDIKGVLKGAADMDEACRESDFFANPAQVHAACQFLMQTAKRKPIAVTFSYSQRLASMADWYAQLLAESIGKRRARDGRDVFAGPTPVRALGVTDQHSQVQLYTEGPFDKWFTLLSVDEPDHGIEIPRAFEDLEGAAYLGGRTLKELFAAERDGTRIALVQAGRPSATIALKKVDPHQVGQLLALLEISVALMGEHYGVDAFDQPGVEAGKIAAYALMGRAGFEARRKEIEGAAPQTRHLV